MKRYNLILGIVLLATMEIMSVKCKAQSYIPLDWETTWGLNLSYDFSKEYLGSFSYSETPYWGEGLYYHSVGVGFPRSYKNICYNVSIPDKIITKLTIINGDTTQYNYLPFNRDTTITNYSFGYCYYEPGINIGSYITISCKLGFSLASYETKISGMPAYNSEIHIINDTPNSGSSSHNISSHSETPSITDTQYKACMLLAPNIIGHIPISNKLRLVTNVCYNFSVPLTPSESPSKPSGFSIGVGLEFVLD